jgi:imidazolonepropionase-like amidohydrolase
MVLQGGEIHTGTGKTYDNGTIVVGEDGEITDVGTQNIDLPADAEIVDLDGRVVTPGLIDAQTRLGLVGIWAVSQTRDHNRGGDDPIRAAFRTADAFDPQNVAIPIARTGGVTSVVAAPGGGLVQGQSAWVNLASQEFGYGGVVEAPMGMYVRYGPVGSGSRGRTIEQLRELYDDVEFYRDHEREYDDNRSRDLAASRLDLEAMEATLEGLPVVFEVHKANDIRRVLEFADAYGLDPIVSGGAEAWIVADELAERDVPVVLHPMKNLPTGFDTLGARRDNAALLADAGVQVVLSTFGTHKVQRLRQLAGNAVRAGLSHREALAAVTQHPAEVFGMEERYGSIASDRAANLVVWSGDPFEMSTRVEQMYIRGESVSLDNRQRALFERYRTLEGRGEPADEHPERSEDESSSE